MRNRIFVFFVAALVMLSCMACGSTEGKTQIENGGSAAAISDNSTATTEEPIAPARERSELLPGTYKVPKRNIYVDTPIYNVLESGYTQIYMDGETKFITFNCMRDDVAADAKDAFDVIYPKFKNNVANQHAIEGDSFTIKETFDLNGMTVCRVSGTVECGMVTFENCYFYGYSFIFEGVPCGIFGVVSDWKQPKEEIDSVTELVDEMMKSVRSAL